jgi:translation elongation factor EF-1beta
MSAENQQQANIEPQSPEVNYDHLLSDITKEIEEITNALINDNKEDDTEAEKQ